MSRFHRLGAGKIHFGGGIVTCGLRPGLSGPCIKAPLLALRTPAAEALSKRRKRLMPNGMCTDLWEDIVHLNLGSVLLNRACSCLETGSGPADMCCCLYRIKHSLPVSSSPLELAKPVDL